MKRFPSPRMCVSNPVNVSRRMRAHHGAIPKGTKEGRRMNDAQTHYDSAQAAQFAGAQQAAVAQQNATLREKEQQQRAEAIKKSAEAATKNPRTILEVESDQPNFLDQPVLLEGTIKLDNFYSHGYNRAEQTHYCFRITDSTGRCYAYTEHENAANLRQQLISAGRPVKGAFSVVLLSRRYNARSH